METIERRGTSRRYKGKSSGITYRKCSHFRRTRFGGFEEEQVICYLWDIVKALETEPDTAAEQNADLKKQMRQRIRVEMRRYFASHKRRNVKILAGALSILLCVACLFGFVIGIDRVAGTSMYPYLNDNDWIVYSRIAGEIRRNDVVVFEKNGETMIKRVVGLPGEQVEINREGNQVVVNGEQIREEYVTITEPVAGASQDMASPTQVIMNGQYLVLGDNRVESVDSRDRNIGTVPSEDVLGKVIWVIRNGR